MLSRSYNRSLWYCLCLHQSLCYHINQYSSLLANLKTKWRYVLGALLIAPNALFLFNTWLAMYVGYQPDICWIISFITRRYEIHPQNQFCRYPTEISPDICGSLLVALTTIFWSVSGHPHPWFLHEYISPSLGFIPSMLD